MFIKKGSMFGLDARIALAIFGALSVISGAALYSAIQESRVASTIAELNELGKAYEAYVLDTGQQPPINTTEAAFLDILELIESSVAGWQGPYISYEKDGSNTDSIIHNGKKYHLVYRPATDWGDPKNGGAAVVPPNSCATAPCYVFTMFESNDLELAKAIDKKVDGTLDGSKGKVRIYNTKNYVYYQYALAVKQP